MWALLVVVTFTLLAAVRSETQPSPEAKNTYGGNCAVEDDCESVYICNSQRRCDCRIGQVISSDKRTCLDVVLFGEPCNETAQCRLHVPNSLCNLTCQCEPGFLHVDSDDHRCNPDLKNYEETCSPPAACAEPFVCAEEKCGCPGNHTYSQKQRTCLLDSGSLTAQFSVGLVMVACLFSCVLSAKPHNM